jgi:hypothetical protein
MPLRDKFFHERLLFGKQLLALRNMTALHSSFIFARPIVHFALLCSATIAAFTASAGDRIPPKCWIAKTMAQEAEALREKRARLIKAEAEREAASLLREAAERIMASPAGLELRRMQMITEVGAEQNTMTIIMMPSEFVEMARAIGAKSTGKE